MTSWITYQEVKHNYFLALSYQAHNRVPTRFLSPQINSLSRQINSLWPIDRISLVQSNARKRPPKMRRCSGSLIGGGRLRESTNRGSLPRRGPNASYFFKDNQLLHAISKLRVSIAQWQRSHHASSDRLKEVKNNGKYIRQAKNWLRLLIRGCRLRQVLIVGIWPGAPNENVVQNQLNIALLNVF